MKRIALTVDQEAMFAATGKFHPVNKFVARSEKIVGLVETITGDVIVSIKTSEISPVVKVAVKNSFWEVSDFLCE
ncbi:hypothetical protein CPT_Metamorpho_148 [Klebsiella phage Metamorpho]|nr:hypothetical protein CPT_Metamorpho_148 [Klebsiella phage Metamorpho]